MSKNKRRNGKDPIHDGTYCDPNCPFFKKQKNSLEADCLKTGEGISYFDGYLQHCELEEEDEE